MRQTIRVKTHQRENLTHGVFSRKVHEGSKAAAIQRLDAGGPVAEVARAFEVNPNLLHRRRKEFRDGPGNAFRGGGKQRWDEGTVAQLERKVGQQTVEIHFLKECLQRIEEQQTLQALTVRVVPVLSEAMKFKCRACHSWANFLPARYPPERFLLPGTGSEIGTSSA